MKLTVKPNQNNKGVVHQSRVRHDMVDLITEAGLVWATVHIDMFAGLPEAYNRLYRQGEAVELEVNE